MFKKILIANRGEIEGAAKAEPISGDIGYDVFITEAWLF